VADADPSPAVRNVYLLGGVRGGYRLRSAGFPVAVEFALLHIIDVHWGIPLPWGACDSGADLESPGNAVLRGWTQVDLRSEDGGVPNDVPIAGLLRTMWDALELFGSPSLSGVDVIAPVEYVGDLLWHRVLGSGLGDSARTSERPTRVLVQATSAWPPSSSQGTWDTTAIGEALGQVIEVGATMGAVPLASYPPSAGPSPFAFGIEHPWASSDTDPFRAEIVPRAWTIDDAAWLAEAVAAACSQAGVNDDVQIAVRLMPNA
jgi:hypothetical protein